MSRKRDITSLSDLDAPCDSADVHGAITSISPIKRGRKSEFFDATIADTTSKIRVVGFTPQQQLRLKTLHTSKSPVTFSNCQIRNVCFCF